jgi:hypothetical protein
MGACGSVIGGLIFENQVILGSRQSGLLVSLAPAAAEHTGEGTMSLHQSLFATLVGVGSLVISLATSVMGQTYPTRPITMIVPFAPGGGTDALARIMAESMRRSLGQPIIIENVAGATARSVSVALFARQEMGTR